MKHIAWWLIAVCLPASAVACDLRSRVGTLDLATASLTEVVEALEQRKVTSEQLVAGYLKRAAKCDSETRAVLSLNPRARAEARQLDAERKAGKPRGELHGVPIIVKDNIDVAGLVTTAGSLALADNLRAADAPLVKRLRDAGAIVLGKSNLSEWANFRSRNSSSGWSAVGGLTRNAVDATRSACGSSSGSAVVVASRFAAAAIGTETNGSIVCPASVNGVVGFKPTVGMVSQDGIVPISHTQDTAGPMAANVLDAALMLSAIAERDREPPYNLPAGTNSLPGARLGVARFLKGYSPATEQAFNAALETLKPAGIQLVDIDSFDMAELRELQLPILLTEFKAGVEIYLATTPSSVRSRSLADLIEFNRSEPRELEFFGQDLFEQAQATAGLDDSAYQQKLARARELAREQGIERLLREHEVLAILAPTSGPAWSIDLVNGDRSVGSASSLAAVAGCPHLTLPLGKVSGLPVGLSIFGACGSDWRLLAFGAQIERFLAK